MLSFSFLSFPKVYIAGQNYASLGLTPRTAICAVSSNNYVLVKSFGGANISDMEDCLKPIIRKEPANLILHVATNDIRKSLTTHQSAEGIVNLGIQISQDSPSTNITISGILPRTDKPNLQEKLSLLRRASLSIYK
jgi:hypothetical protein